MAFDFLQVDAHHGAVSLVANKQLVLERAKFAASRVADDSRGGLPHLAVRKIDRRRLELRDRSGLDHHAAAAERFVRAFAHDVSGSFIPAIARRMTDEAAGAQPLEAAGAVPRSLIVGIEHVADGVGTDTARRAEPAGG